jgi:hypothetical protein
MKIFYSSMLFIMTLAFLPGCNGKKAPKKEADAVIDTVTVSDTGYTGIKQYMSGKYLIKEVTFKNGIREGLMKSFYMTGEVRHTFLYKNGLREDSSIWFFQEGQKFCVTPFKKDTVDGIQKQYYSTGQLKAKLGYSRGLRTTFFQEFTPEGKLVGGYPSMVVKVTDNYKTQGIYKIGLELSDKSPKVRFWRGDYSNGLFDTVHCEKLKTIKGTATLNLKKTTAPGPGYIGVIAEILTNFGNNFLVYKKIDLPYKDLK